MQDLGSDEAAAQEAREAETPWRSATHLRSDAWTQGFAPGNRTQWRSGPVSERPPLVAWWRAWRQVLLGGQLARSL